MEGLEVNPSFWKDKTVFLTGHTGFKGGWIAHWLNELGASVHGYSINLPTQPNFFTETKLLEVLTNSTTGDIRDLAALTNAVRLAKPDIIIHMAAQALVRKSYDTPVETFASNVMGTINVMEAARQVGSAKAILIITTDKCYENREWCWPYREIDRLGGHDPYSASKACAEIAVAAFRNSFLANTDIHLASVRAGNVIGGGDWAADRLIPDFLRALDANTTLNIRSPNAIRPWQHVLEPLSGYLSLAEKLHTKGQSFAEAWNFGPKDENSRSVRWILDHLCIYAQGVKWQCKSPQNLCEAGSLLIDSSKAKERLSWVPRWNLETALHKTVEWHQAWRNKENMAAVTSRQIQAYIES